MSAGFPTEWREIVTSWAATKDRVWEVHLFGSRAKGDFEAASDADIAVVLLGEDCGETLAYSMFEGDGWQDELQTLLPVVVDLQFADRRGDNVVWPAVLNHGVLVYRKAGYRDAAQAP